MPISSLTAGLAASNAIPATVKTQASTRLNKGAPFIPDSDLDAQLTAAGVPKNATKAIVDEISVARLNALREALWIVALLTIGALFAAGLIPTTPIGQPDDSDLRSPVPNST